MSKSSGSPRGTIHLHSADAVPFEIDEDETTEKQDNRGSLGVQLERVNDGIEKIAKLLISESQKAVNQYIDPCPRDNTPHLFVLYPDSAGLSSARPGHMLLMMDGERVNSKSQFEFFGSAIDFVEKAMHAIPELRKIFICKRDMVPESIYRVLSHEFPKRAVKVIDDSYYADQDKEVMKEFESEETRDHSLTPQQISQMQDGYHKLRGFQVASVSERINKIAYYVARTPKDEVEKGKKEWGIFPDKPTDPGEDDTIDTFSTRDEAVRIMKEMEANTGEDISLASELHQANVMSEWMSPEDAVNAAWSLRDKEKNSDEEEA
jgi:hypothetical protein